MMWRAACVVVLLTTTVFAQYPDDQPCPEDCTCHYFRVNYVTDCSESNFTEIPYDELSPNVYILDMNGNEVSEVVKFPEDMKMRRLQMAENKLTKVTADMFAGLKYILDIDLSSNNITTVEPDAFRDSPGLITIELQNNPLERVNAGPFLACRSLIYLDISNCGLSHLNDDFFSGVPFLTTLYLSGNPLTNISLNLLTSLVTLEELKLSQCNLSYLHPDFLGNLIHLKLLDLSQNNFKDVEWETILAGLTRLENLNLERSGLNGLPDNVFNNNSWIRIVNLSKNDFSETDIGTTLGDNLKNLHYLDLGSCSLRSLDEMSFANAEKLTTLYLCNNNLLPRELLTALIPLKKLTSLSLRNCSLTRLPRSIFENLTELRHLDISWNPLNNVFEDLLQPLHQLEYLNMGYSNLNKLAKNTFSQTTNLKKLVLSGNKLGELESGLFKELTNLESLEMNYCGLGNPLDQDIFFNETYTELQELRMAGNPLKMHEGPLIPGQLSKLKILDLSNCSIAYLPRRAFSTVLNLTHLYLHSNQITSKVANESIFLAYLHHLQYLDISSNNLTQLNIDFSAGTALRDINFTGNPWVCDCNIADWWNWAQMNAGRLIGATLTEEDLVKGGAKRKKALLCTVDPKRSPLIPRNPSRRTRVETVTKTWARYLKESPCGLDYVPIPNRTARVPLLLSEPILQSPGCASSHALDEKLEDHRHSSGLEVEQGESSPPVQIAMAGGLSAVILALAAVVGVYLRSRYTTQAQAQLNIELATAPQRN